MVQAEDLINNEYNAFGPWILEVTAENPMPSLFLPYYKENLNCLMLIKIPKKVDRRSAKPGMDLYDYVIGMYETYGYILKNKDKVIEETKFYYDQVESIEDYVDLIMGKLTIRFKNNTIIIPYNAVSKEIISRLVKIIRDRYTKTKYDNISIIKEIEKSKITEVLYVNIIDTMNSQGDVLNVMAFQPDVYIKNRDRGLEQKLLGMFRSKLLLSTIHLLNDKELLVINRGKPFKNTRDAVYSYDFTYVPIEKIKNIKFDTSEDYDNLRTLCISTEESSYMFYFDKKNESLVGSYKKLMELF